MARTSMHICELQNQFYLRRKNTMLIEQQLACDKGKAAKGPKWSSSQAATFKAANLPEEFKIRENGTSAVTTVSAAELPSMEQRFSRFS